MRQRTIGWGESSLHIVRLNDAEQQIAKALAEARHKSNRSQGIIDQQVGKDDPMFIDLNGIGGEMAFCKASNIYPDLSLDSHPIHDCFLYDALWDVKTTPRQNGRLLARPTKRGVKQCDYYVLVIGEMPEYGVVGWASAADLFRPDNLVDLGHGPTYALRQDQLQSCDWIPNGEVK